MKVIGKLRKDVESAQDKAEAKKIIEQAGMLLTDEEMDAVAGGDRLWMVPGEPECPDCPGTQMEYYCEDLAGGLITYICPICHNSITLFDQG